jgi:hypothetical protein
MPAADQFTSLVSSEAPSPTGRMQTRRDTIVLVRWALVIACAYLVLFSEGSSGARGLGPWVIVVFLASNLVVGRFSLEFLSTPRFVIGIGVLDSVLIGASLYCAGQMSVELLVLFLGVLVSAIAGFRSGLIAGITLGLTFASLLIVWFGGAQPLWRSSMLLRVPFLLAAALVYAWLSEAGRHLPSADGQADAMRPSGYGVDALMQDLSRQLDAIKRCQTALANGSLAAAQTAMAEIAQQHREISATAARLRSAGSETRGLRAA